MALTGTLDAPKAAATKGQKYTDSETCCYTPPPPAVPHSSTSTSTEVDAELCAPLLAPPPRTDPETADPDVLESRSAVTARRLAPPAFITLPDSRIIIYT